ncbi:folylpolyglutamate synthase-like [Bidens hawaiensis]|uniref:folylpolyglutamate synthase-like n=1 Tax=Bidens hawaiensis TaxID=980011 RepID=UPI004049C5CD
MQALKETVYLQVANQLDGNLLNESHLELAGDHTYVNAGLAVMISYMWLQRTGQLEVIPVEMTVSTAKRETIYKDGPRLLLIGIVKVKVVFYLDGAHSTKSMEACANCFSYATKDHRLERCSKKESTQILLFNCMSVKDPQLLFPRLLDTCACQDTSVTYHVCIFFLFLF